MPDITAQAADGTRHVFPDGTDVAVIDAAMKRYASAGQTGAFQATKGGPILNARSLNQPAPEESSDMTKRLRGGTLGLAEGAGIQPGGSFMDVIKNTLSNFGGGVKDLATQSFGESQKFLGEKGYDSPLSLAVTPVNMLAHIIENSATNLEKTGGEAKQAVKGGDLEGLYHALGSGAGQLLALRGGRAAGEGAITNPLDTARTVGKTSMQNLMNQGPAKAGFIAKQVERANAVQSTIKSTLDAVHNDGKQLMGHVSSQIDAAHPEGVFEKAEVRNTVKDAMGVIQGEQKIPAAIGKILEQEKGPRSTGPTVGGRHFDLSNPSDLKTFQNMKSKGVFTPEEIARMETGGAVGKMSFEELKQTHSEIGRQIANAEGPVEAGVKAAYAKIATMLRNSAESHGLLNEWKEGAEKVKTFNDIAYRSPLKDTYFGGNHGKIMKPLISDELGPAVQKHLEKIEPYGLDLDALKQTVDGYRFGKKMDMLNEPSRLTPILAAISPKMAALRIAIPRAIRTGEVTDYLYGKGLESVPEVKPNKIYPSKLAAAKAIK